MDTGNNKGIEEEKSIVSEKEFEVIKEKIKERPIY